jgi:hypothetical protein
MYLTSFDMLHLIGALCLLVVGGFICWALYEFARILRQANEVIEETRDKVNRVEQLVAGLADRLGHASPYLGVLSAAAKQLFGVMAERKRKRHADDEHTEDEAWAETIVRKRRHG